MRAAPVNTFPTELADEAIYILRETAAQFERPQTPGRLVEVLATEGFLTPTEADRLRQLVDKRNRLVHGELQIRATKAELDAFTRTLENLLDMVGKVNAPVA